MDNLPVPTKRRDSHEPLKWNLQVASREFGVHREILERRRRAKGMEPCFPPFYSTPQITELVFGDNKAQADLELVVAKKSEIELNMEVTRRERIPIEDVEEHNDHVLQNVAGIFKAHEGKVLTPELIQEIFAEFRRMDEILADYCRKAHKEEQASLPPAEPMDDPMF